MLLRMNTAGLTNPTTSSSCNMPPWQSFVDRSSFGATLYNGPENITACLEHCLQTTGCVAVDVQANVYPPGCWVHTNRSRLIPTNTYFLAGTTQYRLVPACSSVAPGEYEITVLFCVRKRSRVLIYSWWWQIATFTWIDLFKITILILLVIYCCL